MEAIFIVITGRPLLCQMEKSSISTQGISSRLWIHTESTHWQSGLEANWSSKPQIKQCGKKAKLHADKVLNPHLCSG